MPYMIGNGWGGGLVPFITTAAFTATGSVAYALIYPIAVPAICFVLGLFLMPETKQMKIWEAPAPARASGAKPARLIACGAERQRTFLSAE